MASLDSQDGAGSGKVIFVHNVSGSSQVAVEEGQRVQSELEGVDLRRDTDTFKDT